MEDSVVDEAHGPRCGCCPPGAGTRRESVARLRAEAAALLVEANESQGVRSDPRWVELARQARL